MSFKDVLNKHYGHTQNSMKKYEVGGKVVTKNGATNDAKKGGYFDGRPHSQGGIKAVNIDVNQHIEVEGGEVVITKRAVADTTKKEFEGKMMTNKEILSKINQSGGGVAFEHGGEIHAEEMADVAGNTALGAEMQFAEGGKIDDDFELSDDDLNFDFDEEEFEDGGMIPQANKSNQAVSNRDVRIQQNLKVGDKVEISREEMRVVGFDGRDKNLDLLRGEVVGIREISQMKRTENPDGIVYSIDYVVPDKSGGLNGQWEAKDLVLLKEDNNPKVPVLSPIEVKILELLKIKNDQNKLAELDYLARALVKKKTSVQDAFTKTDLKNTLKKLNGGVDGKEIYYISKTKGYSGTLEKQIFGITQDGLDYLKNISPSNSNQSNQPQVNPNFEEFPYFAPDAIKEYNPSVLTVQTRSEDSKLLNSEFNEKSRKKEKNIEIYAQLINDIPVENVVERVELSLLLNQEEEELKLMQNESYIRMPNYQFTDSEGNPQEIQRSTNSESLQDLISMAKVEEFALVKSRPTEYSFLSTFTDMLTECVIFNEYFLANWIINFFGNWIKYSNDNGNSYSYLSNPDNLPFEISKVGRAVTLQSKDYYAPMMVYQGLSQTYDRVGFDIFPISYYATNYSYANWFAETKGEKLGTKGVILPCILNILRPLDLSMFGIKKVNSKNFFDAIYLQTGFTPEDLKVNPAFLLENTPDLEVWVYIRNNPEMLKLLKESKIVDGIHMFENNPSVDVENSAYQTEVWITFYPEQTKVLPIFQMKQIFDGERGKFDRGWFTKSQFLKRGGKL